MRNNLWKGAIYLRSPVFQSCLSLSFCAAAWKHASCSNKGQKACRLNFETPRVSNRSYLSAEKAFVMLGSASWIKSGDKKAPLRYLWLALNVLLSDGSTGLSAFVHQRKSGGEEEEENELILFVVKVLMLVRKRSMHILLGLLSCAAFLTCNRVSLWRIGDMAFKSYNGAADCS